MVLACFRCFGTQSICRVDRQSANEELFKKLMDDPEFNAAVRELLLKRVYERLADEPAA